MTVHIVSFQTEDGDNIAGAFSTVELAETYMDNHPLGDYGVYDPIVHCAVDDMTGQKTWYYFTLDKNGEQVQSAITGAYEQDDPTNASNDGLHDLSWNGSMRRVELTVKVAADSLEEGLARANRVRTDLLATGKWAVTDV